MNRSIVVAGIVFATSHLAAAAPDKRCYAGTQVATVGTLNTTAKMVEIREIDRDANEIRQTLWTSAAPDTARLQRIKVAPDKDTFVFDDDKLNVRVTGSFSGKRWAWTSYHATASAPSGLQLTFDGQLDGDTLRVITDGHLGNSAIKSKVEATAFDCALIDDRRADLRKP